MPSRSFPTSPASVPEARHYVTELLQQLPDQVRDTAALLVSELATNAVRHAGGRVFEVAVRYSAEEDRLWVGVTDAGSADPVLRRPRITDEHGRGLQLVGSLAYDAVARQQPDRASRQLLIAGAALVAIGYGFSSLSSLYPVARGPQPIAYLYHETDQPTESPVLPRLAHDSAGEVDRRRHRI